MAYKHGFYSRHPQLNPDRQRQSNHIPQDDLVYAERFLHADTTPDPIRAHNIVKQIYQAGKRRYPTLWIRARNYVHGYEYESMEKLSNLPTVPINK